MSQRVVCAVVAVLCASAESYADHHGMTVASSDSTASSVDVSVSLLAASFSPSHSAMQGYGGNYQGILPTATWSRGAIATGASWSYYRLERNGAAAFGLGDVAVHGQLALLHGDDAHAGILAVFSIPTGNAASGFGMGHAMAMPTAYGTWRGRRISGTAQVGYSRALATIMHVHGMAPTVDPMNMSELTWSTSGEVAIKRSVRAGARISGGIPIGASGTQRVVGAVVVAWGAGRFASTAELQSGLVGDPFSIRGVVSTGLHF